MRPQILGFCLFVILLCCTPAIAGNIAATKHNFSSSSTNNLYSTDSQLCIFCHTPHNAQPAVPLWNHVSSDDSYLMYGFDFMTDRWSLEYKHEKMPSAPSGASKLCLSCHDGTIAIGALNVRDVDIKQIVSGTIDDQDQLISSANLTKDLTDDHPVSIPIVIHDEPPIVDELRKPAFDSPVRLENELVQCSSCHDPHSNESKFLVMTPDGGQLCLECHDQTGWSDSAHALANDFQWISPGGITKTVSDWACLGCHQMHHASTTHLLQVGLGTSGAETEQVCFKCHGPSGVQGLQDIVTEFSKAYRHPVANTTDTHYFTEPNPPVETHVECEDCHDPHQVQTSDHVLGVDIAEGSIIGIKAKTLGPNSFDLASAAWSPPTYGDVQEVSYEYELCLKCHGTESPMDLTRDHMEEIDVYFNPQNEASHGCITRNDKINPFVTATFVDKSWTDATTIACTDCHGTDSTSVSGPHGSAENWLLKKSSNPDRGGNNVICYDCHDPDVYGENGINGSLSAFDLHTYDKHWVNSIEFPPEIPKINCFLCHGDFSNGDSRDAIPSIYYTPGMSTGYTPGGLHGANSGRASRPTETSGYHFLNGLAIKIVSPEENLLASPNEITCGSALEGGYGCQQHTTKDQKYIR